MLPAELAELVRRIQKQKPEGQTIEIKSAHEDVPKRLYDTLSSFSNQDQGGIIVFGIDEQKNYAVAGIYDPQDLQKTLPNSAIRWNRRSELSLPLLKSMGNRFALLKSPP